MKISFFYTLQGRMMQIIRPVLAVFFFFSLFFFSACANRPEIPVQKSSNQTEATSAETEMGKQNSSAPSKVQASRSGVSFEASETLWVLEFSRPEFAFKLPSSDWGLVSDPADESAPLEFSKRRRDAALKFKRFCSEMENRRM